MGWVHLDVEGTGRDLLDVEKSGSGFPGHSIGLAAALDAQGPTESKGNL